MYSRLTIVSKSKSNTYSKFQHSIITNFLQIGPLFGVLHIRKKNKEISLFRKMAEQKPGTSANISPKPCKAKLFVNFLRKLYLKIGKVLKIGCIKAHTPFSPIFSWTNTKGVQNWRLKILVYFYCFFGPQDLEKGSLSLKKLVIMWKYMKHWFQNGVVYIFILSHSEARCIFVKSLKIGKMARPVGQDCRNTA